MRTTLLVAWKELAERKHVLFAAALSSALPFLAPLAPWFAGWPPGEIRLAAAAVVAGILAVGVAVIHGSSTVAGEVAARRLSFLLSRPLGSFAIWTGKMLSGLVLAWLVALLSFLPTAVLGGPELLRDRGLESFSEDLHLVILAPLVLLLLANALAAMLRDRSGWLAFDLVGLAAVALLSLWARNELETMTGSLGYLVETVTTLLQVVAVLALFVAGAVQVAAGRVDGRRGHRALSAVLWGITLIAAAAALGYGRWIAAPPFSAARDAGGVVPAPTGSWLFVEARVPSRGNVSWLWLVDAASARALRVGPDAKIGRLSFAPDGQRAVWSRSLSLGEGSRWWPSAARSTARTVDQLVTLDLAEPALRPRGTTLLFDGVRDIELSASGRRVAVVDGERVAVFDLEGERLLASLGRPPEAVVFVARFVGEDLLVVFTGERSDDRGWRWRMAGLAVDPSHRRLVEVWSCDRAVSPSRWFANAAGDRLLHYAVGLSDVKGGAWLEREVRSGNVLRTFPSEPEWWPWAGRYLADGRVVLAESRGRSGRLRVVEREGTAARVIAVGELASMALGPEIRPGVLLLWAERVIPGPPPQAVPESLAVNLETGECEVVEPGLRFGEPAPANLFGHTVDVGGLSASLFRTENNALVFRDPRTGARRTLLRGR